MSPITETSELEAYLKAAGVPFVSVQPLSGGTANYVWRLREQSGTTKVIKHAEGYVKSSKQMAFSADRMDFEAHALATLPALIAQDDATVHGAYLHQYDSENHVMIISDGGKANLKDSYAELSIDEVFSAGQRLGNWLARLHSKTSGSAALNLRNQFDHQTAKAIYRHSYYSLPTALKERSADESEIALASKINDEFGSLLAVDDENVCHGDFWTGNVLVDEEQHLTIVDWEMTRKGCGATDVGQFTAEAWLLDRFRGGKGLVRAFINAYASSSSRSKLADEDAVRWTIRAIVHYGTHLAYWPLRVPWGNEEETNDVHAHGMEILRKVVGNDLAWLRKKTPFAPLIPSIS